MFWPDQRDVANDAANNMDVDPQDEKLNQVLDSILKVHCTHSEPDLIMPWQRLAQSTSTSSGFVIELASNANNTTVDSTETISSSSNNRRVMTNAHSVEYGSIIQVQLRGQEKKYEAVLEVLANECDLAILRVDDDRFWSDNSDCLYPLEFGPLPALQDEVEVLGYPTGGDSLSITQGVVSRIEMQEYTQASSNLLAIQIDAAINAGNSGGPVVNEDLQVIGVAFQGLDDAQNIGYVIPVTVIQHILQDVQRNGRYTGFCLLGVGLSFLENKAFRKSLGMMGMDGADGDDDDKKRQLSGVMVREVAPTSPAKGILLPNDVIMRCDNIPIGNDGKIPFRRGERVALACYIHTKIVGDLIKLKVLRDRKEIEIDVPVGISKRLVPSHWKNRPPPYYIVGGLVFTALSVPYLYASGAWDDYVSPNMSYLLSLLHKPLERETDEVVILIQVLAHRENLGYDKLADLRLETVNDQTVRSLAHLKTIVEECDTEFLRFGFSPDNSIVVMEHSLLEGVTKDVCSEHSIQKSSFLHLISNEEPNTSSSSA